MIDAIISSVVGLMFGAGLVISGMAKRSKILGFLTLNKSWDRIIYLYNCSFVDFCYDGCCVS